MVRQRALRVPLRRPRIAVVQELRDDGVVPDGAGCHRREAVPEIVRSHRRGTRERVGEIGPLFAEGGDGSIAGGRERAMKRRSGERLSPAVGRIEGPERREAVVRQWFPTRRRAKAFLAAWGQHRGGRRVPVNVGSRHASQLRRRDRAIGEDARARLRARQGGPLAAIADLVSQSIDDPIGHMARLGRRFAETTAHCAAGWRPLSRRARCTHATAQSGTCSPSTPPGASRHGLY